MQFFECTQWPGNGVAHKIVSNFDPRNGWAKPLPTNMSTDDALAVAALKKAGVERCYTDHYRSALGYFVVVVRAGFAGSIVAEYEASELAISEVK